VATFPGKLESLNTKAIYNDLPAPTENFLGREQEMYYILKSIGENRLVSILGPPGIGKTSLSRNLAHYIKARGIFKDGIIYVSLRSCSSAQMFLTRMYFHVRKTVKPEVLIQYGIGDIEDPKQEMEQSRVDSIRKFVIGTLRD
jgi:AAA+ ATPase superfamily predicted ATPase